MTPTADLSLEQRVAMLSPEEREEMLEGADLAALEYDWSWNGRPNQILPVLPHELGSDFSVALILAGRGFGKTLTGAQWIRALDAAWPILGRDTSRLRIALLGRTSADVRDVMLEGSSGLLNIWPPSLRDRVHWYPSRRRLDLPNGAMCTVFSSEEPAQLRGPQMHAGWADEIGTYKQIRSSEDDATAWQNLRIATRLGSQPQILATTTPKRVPLLRELLAEHHRSPRKILLRRGRTRDNRYLSNAYLDVLEGLYGGTALGRQELEGEMLDDVAGATTSEAIIDRYRITKMPPNMPWIKVVSVDPTVAERPHDECGIVVLYITRTWPVIHRHAVVVDDLSGRYAPAEWGDVALKAAHKHDATVIAEVNQGGNLVFQMLRQAAAASGLPMPPMKEVWSSKNKAVRAEPVSGAYARGRCVAAGTLITTRRGLVPIEQVTTIDEVLTRRGWRPVICAGRTGDSVPVVTVRTASGRALTCTHDHPVFVVDRGFVRAVDLDPMSDRLLAWDQPPLVSTAGGGLATPGVFGAIHAPQRNAGGLVPCAVSTFGTPGGATSRTMRGIGGADGALRSIGTSGLMRTAPSLTDGMYITATTTQATTTYRTSLPGRPVVTPNITTRPVSEPGFGMTHWPRHGARRHGGDGRIRDLSVACATGARKYSSLLPLAPASVPNAVTPPTGTTRSDPVSQVSQSGTRDVWNLSIQGDPEFFAGGVLVHNCHHLNVLADLESQLTSWVYGDSGYSPDRMDAAVMGLAAGLFPEAVTSGMPGSTQLRSVADQHIPLPSSRGGLALPGRWR